MLAIHVVLLPDSRFDFEVERGHGQKMTGDSKITPRPFAILKKYVSISRRHGMDSFSIVDSDKAIQVMVYKLK